jgi:hypothetical protein
MLHEAMINFLRWIVNQTRAFFCRAAAQFNQPVQRMSAADFGGNSGILAALIADPFRSA